MVKPKNPNWEKEYNEAIANGLSHNQACMAARVSPQTANKHGYSAGAFIPTELQVEETRRLRGLGYTISEVCKELSLNTHQVTLICHNYDIKKYPKLNQRYDEIKELMTRGLTTKRIAEIMGIKTNDLHYYMNYQKNSKFIK